MLKPWIAIDTTEVCLKHCCVSMFGNPRATSGSSVPAFDLERREIILPQDQSREYWNEKIRRRQIVCAECLLGPEPTERILVYCESPLGLPYFRHRPGESPDGEFLRGESIWHYTVKYAIRRWAKAQSNVRTAKLEATTRSGKRRADIGVRLTTGERFAIEIQYSPISEELHAARQTDYIEEDIIPIWLYSSDLREPPWAGDNLTFAIRLGPVNETNISSGLHLELGIPFSKPFTLFSFNRAEVEDFLTFADPNRSGALGVRWVPLSNARLTTNGVIVDDNPVSLRRRQEWDAATLAMRRHNSERAFAQRTIRLSSPAARRPSRKTPPRRVEPLEPSSCPTCGMKLDPCLEKVGLHVLC